MYIFLISVLKISGMRKSHSVREFLQDLCFSTDRSQAQMKAIVPMLVMVVTVFILCWTPILIFEVLQAYSVIGAQVFGEVKHMKTVFSLLAYVNRCPLITLLTFCTIYVL